MKTGPVRSRWMGCAAAVLMVSAIATQGLAGNAWNPPLLNKIEEQRLRKVGAEFFKLQGLIYSFLGALEEKDANGAQRLLPLISSALDASASQCSALREKLRTSPEIAEKYNSELVKFDGKTKTYTAAGAIPPSDLLWVSVAKAGYTTLTDLCGTTVREIQAALSPLTQAVRRGAEVSPAGVWKLLNTVETGSKRSRYFSMTLRP